MKYKGFSLPVTLIVLFLVLVVGAAGYFVWGNMSNGKSNIQTATSTTVSNTWTTFTSLRLGFSIKYPPTVSIQELPGTGDVAYPAGIRFIDAQSGHTFAALVTSPHNWFPVQVISTTTLMLGSLHVLKTQEYELQTEQPGSMGVDDISYNFTTPNKSQWDFFITRSGWAYSKDSQAMTTQQLTEKAALMEQMLSTFTVLQ